MKKKFLLLLTGATIPFITMRVLERDFENVSGREFDIMAFELPGSAGNLTSLIQQWQDPLEKSFLLHQLYIDFIFMAFLFPAIACLCFWAAGESKRLASRGFNTFFLAHTVLTFLAYAQFAALVMDVSENIRLINYVNAAGATQILAFEFMVRLKFALAILGILAGLLTLAVIAGMDTWYKSALIYKAENQKN